MKKKSKYNLLFCLLLPILYLPLPWYAAILPNVDTFSLDNMNGFLVMTRNGGELMIVYLFCIGIQFMAIKSQVGKYFYWFPIIAQIILIFKLTFFFASGEYTNISLVFSRDFFQKFYLGYFLTIISLIMCVLGNLKKIVNSSIK